MTQLQLALLINYIDASVVAKPDSDYKDSLLRALFQSVEQEAQPKHAATGLTPQKGQR